MITLYTLNLHNVTCQLYLHKTGRKASNAQDENLKEYLYNHELGKDFPRITSKSEAMKEKINGSGT